MKKIICFIIMVVLFATLFIVPYSAIVPVSNSYVIEDGEHVTIPTLFELDSIHLELDGSGIFKLKDPQDLFYDTNGFYYISDTGNNRVLKLDTDFKVLNEISEVNGLPFSSPTGVSSDAFGDIYIADSGNGRIVHLDKNFNYIEEFIKPESDLLYNMEYFSPFKVSFDPISNFLYVIQGKQFMKIDAKNQFKGYIGENKVSFDLWDYIFRKFASKKQKSQISKREPDAYTNFCLDSSGKLYSVGLSSNQRISIINTVGKNIYPSGNYGESLFDTNRVEAEPVLTDIAVNDFGIIFVSEKNNGCIYQYDKEGNLLGVFGGKGEGKDAFNIISSIVIGPDNSLVTLDSSTGRIQVFKSTKFTNTIHKAISLYEDGKYDESYKLWIDIKKQNSNYSLARRMIGKIEFKNEDYISAKKEFYQGENQKDYGMVFEKLRYNFFQKHFTLIIIVFVILIVLLILIIRLGRKFIFKVRNELWGGKGVHY